MPRKSARRSASTPSSSIPPVSPPRADATGATHVVGPFTPKPKITTGAGDHFNAGFCIGRLLDLGLAASLQIGVATSGYYVRHAKSPRSTI